MQPMMKTSSSQVPTFNHAPKVESSAVQNELHKLNLHQLREQAKQRHEMLDLKQQRVNLFWGGDSKQVWEEWLREKGLLGRSDKEEGKTINGWSDPDETELSEMEDDAWVAGGMRRPGEKGSEDFSSEEPLEWDDDDDDDDDHGGQMMPIPSL